jgi:hypothetical protein
MDNQEQLVNSLVEALQNEKVINAFLQAIENKKNTPSTPKKSDVWQQHLEASGLALADDVDAEELAKLYPLSQAEIQATVEYLKAEEHDGEISQADVGKAIVIQLGSNNLASRLETTRMMSVSPLANAFSDAVRCGASHDACGARHECGQPYHCGPDFHCGTPFECGWRFEMVPCVSSEIHCTHHEHNMDNPDY